MRVTGWTLILLLVLVIFVSLLVRTLVKRPPSDGISHAKPLVVKAATTRPHAGDSAGAHRSALTVTAEIAGIVGAVVAILALLIR